MTPDEEKIIGECIKACVYSNFFPEWEFHTIFGVYREEAEKVCLLWPNVDLSDPVVMRTVHNSINNLTGYPLGEDDLKQWGRFISISREDLWIKFPQFRGIR